MKACVDYTAQQFTKSGHNADFAKGWVASNQKFHLAELYLTRYRNHFNIRANQFTCNSQPPKDVEFNGPYSTSSYVAPTS
jgi:hypothetical protein